jgi:hypothetical protein
MPVPGQGHNGLHSYSSYSLLILSVFGRWALRSWSAVAKQNSLKVAKDVPKVIDFAHVSRFHTPNNILLVRKANKSG